MVLVALVAMIAAAVTVVVSQRTYGPSERTMSAKTQVAAGSDHTDPAAGLTFRVPAGWEAESGAMPFGTTALLPEGAAAARGAGGIVFLGAVTQEMLAGQDVSNEQAAYSLAMGIGQAVLPIPGSPTEERVEEISSRVGDGTALSFRILPSVPQPMVGPEGALVYSAVVGEGDSRYWLTYIATPGDGSMDSPRAEWADEIVERFELADVPATVGTTT
ncbi:hypothetical protein G6010_13220 [Dietzia sp. SLG510A3-3B2-2]|nr:hypothetical protein [Dietzia sp. SLG510A3-40A3]MBB1010437.1 hypothetical protein [Dietzia sp. SLG510A3-3B2-2]